MKKILLLSIITILFISEVDAQRRSGRIGRRASSVGYVVTTFGPSYCFGDSKDSPFSKTFLDGTNADFSLGFRHKFVNNLGYKVALKYGNYTGTENSYSRGLDFNSSSLQFTVRGEYAYEFGFGRFQRYKPHSIYGFVGAGIVSSKMSHDFVNKLTAEELASKYVEVKTSDFTQITPYGFGYNYDFNNNIMLGAEIGWQFALSDYLDGLHPIITSNSNDILFGVSITVSYKIF